MQLQLQLQLQLLMHMLLNHSHQQNKSLIDDDKSALLVQLIMERAGAPFKITKRLSKVATHMRPSKSILRA